MKSLRCILPLFAAASIVVPMMTGCQKKSDTPSKISNPIEYARDSLNREMQRAAVDTCIYKHSDSIYAKKELDKAKLMAAEYLYGKSVVSADSLDVDSLMNEMHKQFSKTQDGVLPKLYGKLSCANNHYLNSNSTRATQAKQKCDSLQTKLDALDKLERNYENICEIAGATAFILDEIAED